MSGGESGMTALLLLTTVVAAVRGLWSPCGLSMLSSLNPVAEAGRGQRFWITALWYLAGAVAGGAVLGGACALGAWLVGSAGLPFGVRGTLALAGAVAALASDLRIGGWSLPDHPRQVDERWLTTYRRWIYAGGYGVQIGTGFATYVMTAGVYLLAALAVLSGRPGTALAAGGLFGLVRGATIGLAALARDPGRLQSLMARVDAAAGASAGVAVAAHVVVAAGMAALLGGPVAGVAVAAALVLPVRAARRRASSARLEPAPQPRTNSGRRGTSDPADRALPGPSARPAGQRSLGSTFTAT